MGKHARSNGLIHVQEKGQRCFVVVVIGRQPQHLAGHLAHLYDGTAGRAERLRSDRHQPGAQSAHSERGRRQRHAPILLGAHRFQGRTGRAHQKTKGQARTPL